jgi:hypothetical protein
MPNSIVNTLGFLALAALIAGCAGVKTDRTLASERAEAYLASNPKLDPKTAEAIRNNTIRVGMTMAQVVAAWGEPREVQKFRGGKVQHWFFGCDWPHVCDTQGSRRRVGPGGIFEDPNQRYLSNAIFEDGVVVKWGS